jgi:hypothetical protein
MVEKSPFTFPGKNRPSCVAALAHDNYVYTGGSITGGGAPPPIPQPPTFANTWDSASQSGLAQAIASCATELSATYPNIAQQHITGVCAESHATKMVYQMNPMVRAEGKFSDAFNAKIVIWCDWGAAVPCGVSNDRKIGCSKFMDWARVQVVPASTQPSANPPEPILAPAPPPLF